MPFIEIEVIEGVFSDNQKKKMIEKVTDAVKELAAGKN